MKKLCLPSTELIVSNLRSLLLYLFCCLSFACTGQVDSPADVNIQQQNINPAYPSRSLVALVEPIRESWIAIRSTANPQEAGSLRFSAKSCVDNKFAIGTTLHVLGVGYDVVFEEESGLFTVAIIEDSETQINGFELPQDVRDGLCGEMRSSSSSSSLINDQAFKDLQKQILTSVATLTPDCKSLDFDARGIRCKLDIMYPQAALIKTEEFRKSMIRKWSRQPYILARRTGVVSTLAKTASNLGDDDGFAKFCKVLQFSLPEELPVIMTSKRWQSALCSGQSELRRDAAFYGLAKGTQELSMLRELYEGTSRVGVLTVKIPNEIIPGRTPDSSRQPLRVTIAPDPEVSKRLVFEAKKYLGQSEHEDHPKRAVRSKVAKGSRRHVETRPAELMALESLTLNRADMCWHPLFGESWGLLRIADGMKLAGDGFKLDCGYIYEHENADQKEIASLSRYLSQSLSSETEFVLDNGQAKLLRLPEGNYNYTVHVLPANPLDLEELDEENTAKSTGKIAWGTSRTHLIKQW